jgi:hypothetical protein
MVTKQLLSEIYFTVEAWYVNMSIQVFMSIVDFRVVTPCGLVYRFRKIFYLHLQS